MIGHTGRPSRAVARRSSLDRAGRAERGRPTRSRRPPRRRPRLGRAAPGADRHDVAVVLGSGWTPAADRSARSSPRSRSTELGGFAPSTRGGPRRARCARSGAATGGCSRFLGRVHLYEGHEPSHGRARRAHRGAGRVLARSCSPTRPAGCGRACRVGQPRADRRPPQPHRALAAHAGRTATTSGPRFVDLTEAYSPRLRDLARTVDPDLEEGVYAGFAGPQYETPAEIRMLARLGADLVGMSTVHEVIAARHLGAEVLGLLARHEPGRRPGGEKLDHADVLDGRRGRGRGMGDLLARGRRAPVTRAADLDGARPGPGWPRTPTPSPGPRSRRCWPAGRRRRAWPSASAPACSSAPPGCAARSAPGRTA